MVKQNGDKKDAGSLQNIWTGDPSKSPAILKAKEDKVKADSIARDYSEKKKRLLEAAILMAKSANKGK